MKSYTCTWEPNISIYMESTENGKSWKSTIQLVPFTIHLFFTAKYKTIRRNTKVVHVCSKWNTHTHTHFNLQNVISSTLEVFCSALKIKVNWCRCFSIPSSGSLQIPNDIIHMQTTPLLTFSKLNLHLFTLFAFARSPSSTYRCCHAYGTLK